MHLHIHSTRLFPKEKGADAYNINGISARCDWVVLSDFSPPFIHFRKNIETDHPRHIFLSLRSPYEALKYFDECILPRIRSGFVLVSGSEDVTVPNQLDRRFRDFTENEKNSINKILEHPYLFHWFAENLDDDSHPKMSPLPLGMLFKAGMPAMGVQIPSIPPLATRPLRVLCAHRVSDGEQYESRRTVSKLAKEYWSDYCTCLDHEVSEDDCVELLREHAFVLCVEGGGIDPSPKAWLAIMHGAIPIILDNALRSAYQELPVIFVQKWDAESIDVTKLERWHNEFSSIHDDIKSRQEVIGRLGIEYWWRKIERRWLTNLPESIISPENSILAHFSYSEEVHEKSGSAMEAKPVVMILGMHRSGTSCLTGSLQQGGLYLGEVYTENPFNRKGNRENDRIMRLNDALLAKNSADWRTPPAEMAWDQELIRERDDIIREFELNLENMWGFKDPRVLFTFPFWKDGLQNIKMVGTFRHPVSVAQSLNFRNQMAIAVGLELWYAYNCKLLALLEEYDFPLISFDVPAGQYLASVEFVAKYLGLNILLRQNESTFFEETLRTHKECFEVDVPLHIMDIYEKLQQYSQAARPLAPKTSCVV